MAKRYENYSKEQLLEKIKQLEKLRYGLLWEDKIEDVAERCEQFLPVLFEDNSKEIIEAKNSQTNILIEGDNYHSLFTLNFTHKRKVDVIYIDPPYNTGNKDFKYNDHFVDREDSFRHSKWLSFMNKRLKLAKNLLKDTGLIFISIDDNEVAQLKMLCDKIFIESNFVALFIWHARQNVDSRSVTGASNDHQYVLAYRKTDKARLRGKVINTEKYKNPDNDPRGPWMSSPIDGLATKANRPNLHYTIVNPKTEDEYEPSSATGWRFQKSTLEQMIKEKRIIWPKNKASKPRMKRYLQELQNEYTGFSSLLDVDFTTQGTNELREIFGEETLKFPKPVSLIHELVGQSLNKNSIVLDFFAGSGTTGHAVLELNKQDGGNRQFILCTNNENNICEDVTYPRIKKVIMGYNGNNAIPANLKYYKTDFVPQVITDNDKRVLVNRSTELLCISENTFELIKESKPNLEFAIYKSDKQLTAIIYDEDAIMKCKEELVALQPRTKTVIYVFSYDNEYNAEDFEDLSIPFVVKPIPEAILNVYRKNAKIRRK